MATRVTLSDTDQSWRISKVSVAGSYSENLAVFDIVDPAGDCQGFGFEGFLDDGVGAEMFELDDNVALGDGFELFVFG